MEQFAIEPEFDTVIAVYLEADGPALTAVNVRARVGDEVRGRVISAERVVEIQIPAGRFHRPPGQGAILQHAGRVRDLVPDRRPRTRFFAGACKQVMVEAEAVPALDQRILADPGATGVGSLCAKRPEHEPASDMALRIEQEPGRLCAGTRRRREKEKQRCRPNPCACGHKPQLLS